MSLAVCSCTLCFGKSNVKSRLQEVKGDCIYPTVPSCSGKSSVIVKVAVGERRTEKSTLRRHDRSLCIQKQSRGLQWVEVAGMLTPG